MLDRTRFAAKSIGPTDQFVAARIRAGRLEAGMSQTALADGLGVTFQQVQKYEKAVNRVGADRLQKIADKIGKPVSWFFPPEGQSGQPVGDLTTTVVKLLGSNPSIRDIMQGLPNLDREDAAIVASLVKRLAA